MTPERPEFIELSENDLKEIDASTPASAGIGFTLEESVRRAKARAEAWLKSEKKKPESA